MRPDFSLEKDLLRSGKGLIAGIDEAGRGSLAGPLAVGLVIFSAGTILEHEHLSLFSQLNDSKKLTAARRESLLPQIEACALVQTCEFAPAAEVDTLNVTGATIAAAGRILRRINIAPDVLLIDGIVRFGIHGHELAVKKGDGISLTIAAASIVAKVTRDRVMCTLDGVCPGYGFAGHKGYGTASHVQAIRRLGPSAEHRRSFEPVKAWCAVNIENRVTVELGGPLARNDRLRGLRNGALLPVRVVEWRGPRSAVVDLRGNLVQLEFDRVVPRNSMLELRVEGNRGGRMVFSMPALAVESPAAFARADFPPAFVSALAARLVQGGSFAGLLAALFPGLAQSRLHTLRGALQHFLRGGGSAEKMRAAAALLAGDRQPLLRLALGLSSGSAAAEYLQQPEALVAALTDDELVLLWQMVAKDGDVPQWGLVPDDDGRELLFSADERYFAASFELQHLGPCLVLGVQKLRPEVLLVATKFPADEFPFLLRQHMQQTVPEAQLRVCLAAGLADDLIAGAAGPSMFDRKV
jgi:ribonuclease HII